MALQKTFTDASDTTWANAYHRIVIVNLDYASREAYIRVNIYKDAAARVAEKKPCAIRQYYVVNTPASETNPVNNAFDDNFDSPKLSPADVNPVKKAYTYISAQPEYQGAATV